MRSCGQNPLRRKSSRGRDDVATSRGMYTKVTFVEAAAARRDAFKLRTCASRRSSIAACHHWNSAASIFSAAPGCPLPSLDRSGAWSEILVVLQLVLAEPSGAVGTHPETLRLL